MLLLLIALLLLVPPPTNRFLGELPALVVGVKRDDIIATAENYLFSTGALR